MRLNSHQQLLDSLKFELEKIMMETNHKTQKMLDQFTDKLDELMHIRYGTKYITTPRLCQNKHEIDGESIFCGSRAVDISKEGVPICEGCRKKCL